MQQPILENIAGPNACFISDSLLKLHVHRKIACLEEIAYLNGWITKEDVLAVYEELKKNQYGQYLKDVIDGKYLDVVHTDIMDFKNK